VTHLAGISLRSRHAGHRVEFVGHSYCAKSGGNERSLLRGGTTAARVVGNSEVVAVESESRSSSYGCRTERTGPGVRGH